MAGVTIYPSNQEPAALDPKARSILQGQNEINFLEGIQRKKRGTVLQTSFDEHAQGVIFPDNNGFIHSAMNAYNQHYHLKICPEDIWLAILTQLSSYINAHAEELRGSFVAHEGKKELKIEYGGTRFTCDWAAFASSITHMLQENVVDPELREWMLPAFSTTTQQDKIVASIVMMASLQSYFNYAAGFACGLPSVTLLGEKSDYEIILNRLEKLRSYGDEPSQFADLLTAVIKRFIRSFEDPENADVTDFWNRIVSSHRFGSGMDYYSGWLTAFMFWDKDGRLLRDGYRPEKTKKLVLDGAEFHAVKMKSVPRGYCTVPVEIDDNGHKLTAEMLAGSVGCQWQTSGGDANDSGELDTIQPFSGWWIYEKAEGGKKTSQDDNLG